jgi:hypothetical protein
LGRSIEENEIKENAMKWGKNILSGFVLMIAIFVMVFSLYGQYSISSDEYPAIGTTAKYEVDTTNSVLVDVGSPGADQTWEFPQIFTGVNSRAEYVHPDSTPDGDSFPAAEWAFRGFQWIRMDAIPLVGLDQTRELAELTTYERMASDTVFGLGVKVVTPFYEGAVPFDNEATNFVFPMELGQTWERASSYSAQAVIGSIVADPLTVSDSANVVVDGYGTLTIPLGTFPCVRLKITRRLMIVARIQVLTSWMDITVQDSEYITYEWHTEDAGMLLQVTSHSGEANENFTDAGLVVRMDSSSVLTGVECDPTCDPNTSVPSNFMLGQNYPNPFNPTTFIQYVLPEPASVELAIFNLLGQEIALIESGIKNAGVQEAVWNGKDHNNNNVPGGVYFYQLKVVSLNSNQSIIQTRKMVMMK